MDVSKLERMGRRRFMENLAGIGVSATTLQELTQDELTDVTHDPEEEIPYIAAWKNVGRAEDGTVQREPVYETIPREEWERREATMNLRSQVDEELGELDMPGVYATYSRHDSSPTEFGVNVRVPESEGFTEQQRKLEELIPTEASGETPEENTVRFDDIPIEIKGYDREKINCYDTRKYSDVPGGQAIVNGTLTGTFHHSDSGKDGWITAAHVADAGTAVSQETGGNPEYIGTVTESIEEGGSTGPKIDCSFIEPGSNVDISSYITSSDGSYLFAPIEGIILNRELDYNVGNSDYGVRLQGKTSCQKTGHIHEMDQGGDSIDVTKPMASGDSGGPAYRVADGDAYIVGNLVETGPFSTQCTTAETIEDELNGSFI